MMIKLKYSLFFVLALVALSFLCASMQAYNATARAQRDLVKSQNIDPTDLFYTDSEAGRAASRKYFNK